MKNPKAPKTLKLDHSSIQSRLALCAAALAGTAAIPGAEAAIITFTTPLVTPNPFSGVVPATLSGVYINLGTGATAGSSSLVGWDFNPYLRGAGTIGFYWGAGGVGAGGVGTVAGTGPYLSLADGTVIDGSSTFANAIAGTVGSPFVTTGTHVLGFRFFNEATSAINFGYMIMSNTATTGFPTTIMSWSYEDTGAAITVVVPEPATTMLLGISALALGALGLRKWRQQRAE